MEQLGFVYRYYNHDGKCINQSATLKTMVSCYKASKRNLYRWGHLVHYYHIVEVCENVNFTLDKVLVENFDKSDNYAVAY